MSDHYQMPSLGAGMTDGRVLEWYVEPGQVVRKGDVIGLVDTDKGAIEMEAWEDAEIVEILAPPGTKVPVGEPLLGLRPPGEEPSPPAEAPETEAPRDEPAEPETGPPEPEAATAPAPDAAPDFREEGVPRASPAARRRAGELGIPLEEVPGSGPGGAVTLADVEDAREAPPERPRAEPRGPKATPLARRVAAASGVSLEGIRGTGSSGTITREDVERAGETRREEPTPDRNAAMRRAIAAAMERSKREIPHYYLDTEVDLETALRWLERTNRERPPAGRILPAAVHLKAVALALEGYPELNGFREDGTFRPAESVHPGLATSLRGGGLVAPAIHDVGRMSLEEVTARIRDVVQRARTGRLRTSEVAGATITVTSLGERGVDTVFGVIYPPQVAIIGVGTPAERPWAEGGMIGARRTVRLTLAADHRVSDGHRAGLFLTRVAELLQHPEDL